MKYFNSYYIAILCFVGVLWQLNQTMVTNTVSFYGFAENKETEINYNAPIIVAKIHVRPGEYVKANTPLLEVYQMQSKSTIQEEPYQIAELQAKEIMWKTEKEKEIDQLLAKQKLEIDRIETDIAKLTYQKSFDQKLYKKLQSVATKINTYRPMTAKIKALERELSLVKSSYQRQVKAIQQELVIGKNPYQINIERLEAQQQFERTNQRKLIQILAPTDGLVGTIQCKEAEHIPAYQTLISFYEPNPTLVKGFVQEHLLLHVNLRDSFLVRSTKDASILCTGAVVGLGSRVVEIPERLRKMPDIKTYGREVLVAISADNRFLQKEKIILEFINPSKEIIAHSLDDKSLADLQKEKIYERQ